MGAWSITMRQSNYGLDRLGTIVDTKLNQVNSAFLHVVKALEGIKTDIKEWLAHICSVYQTLREHA